MFEELAPKRSGVFRAVFVILVVGFVLLSLPNWIPFLFDFPFVKTIYEFFVFLGMGLSILWLIRSYGTEYRYSLADSVFTVRTKVGAREEVVLQITLTEDSQLVPLSEHRSLLRKQEERRCVAAFGVSDKKSAYLLTFPLQNGKSAVIFQPSAQFVEILQQLLLDKSKKM